MTVSRRLRFEILKRDGHRCRYCGADSADAKLTVDHVIPEALGGSSEPDNLVTACDVCNSGKSSTHPASETVDDVAYDAARWSSAIKLAAERQRQQRARRVDAIGEFEAAWFGWSCSVGDDRVPVPIPDDWDISVGRFVDAGLDGEDLADAVRFAMRSKAAIDRKFRYFCGVAWNLVRQRQDIALELLEGDE